MGEVVVLPMIRFERGARRNKHAEKLQPKAALQRVMHHR